MTEDEMDHVYDMGEDEAKELLIEHMEEREELTKELEELREFKYRAQENTYVLVMWPESQFYMDYPWFEEEAILDIDNDTPSSYFIPTKYMGTQF